MVVQELQGRDESYLNLNSYSKVIILQNRKHEIIYMNEGGLRYFVKDRKNVLGKTCYSLFGSTKMCQGCPRQTVLNTGSSVTENYRSHQGDGCIDFQVSPIFDEKQKLKYTLLSFKTFLEDLPEENQLMATRCISTLVLDHLPYACILSDAEFRMTYWNRSAETIFGYSSNEVIHQNFFSSALLHERNPQLSALDARLHLTGETIFYQKEHLTKDGQKIVCNWTDIPLVSEDQQINGFLSVAHDVTEQHHYRDQLTFQSTHDWLTQLPNRNWFRTYLDEQISVAAKEGARLALVLIDLNHFKDVNSNHGYLAGDQVLKMVADRFKSYCPFYKFARVGGNEFAVLLKGFQRQNDIVKSVRNIFNVLSAPIFLNDCAVEISARAGVACFPEDGMTRFELFPKVDFALSSAKDDIRAVHFYNQHLDRRSEDRLQLMADLRHAIDLNQIELEYQPKISLIDHRLTGFEALVRWQHPRFGRISPDRFLPYAEESDLILPLTRKILELGLRQWRKMVVAKRPVPIAINLSPRLLVDEAIPALLSRLMEKYRIPSDMLEIELTETAIIADPVHAGAILQRISELGIRLAIDDYGTGFSSLTLLKKLPVDVLKIDMSFIQNMLASDQDKIIVQSTIDMAHGLGLRVIAEGVEDEATMELLADLGCDEVQGYYIARPLAAAAARVWQPKIVTKG